MVKSNAQEALDTLVRGFRNRSGKSDPKWESKLNPAEKKRLASARKLAKNTKGEKVSLGQRTAEAFLPDLPRGETGTKREVAKAKIALKAPPPKPTSKGLNIPEKLTKRQFDHFKKGVDEARRLIQENKNIDKARSTPLPVVSITREPNSTVVNNKKSNAPLAQLKAASDHLKAEESDKPFGEKAGRKAIQNFFQTTFGYTPTVSYDFPTEEEARGGMKRGGKVKKTKSKPTKKYAKNRGGKVTSVRKPNRA